MAFDSSRTPIIDHILKMMRDETARAYKAGKLRQEIYYGKSLLDEDEGLVIDVRATLVEDEPDVPLLGAGDAD